MSIFSREEDDYCTKARFQRGLSCLAIARDDGPPVTKTIMTGSKERLLNMHAFAEEGLKLLEEVLLKAQDQGKL